ncbi:hypothetical protein CPC16_008080 [Podila verticillata]|nr:hypothetical protein CPC16_008080 [Podila verticillata]
MINAAAFIRPDLPQLIYAQMTYRVATGFQNLERQTGHSLVQLDLSNNRSLDCEITIRGGLQCVLYFSRNDRSKDSEPSTPVDDKVDSPNRQLPNLPSVLIAKHSAVDEIKLNIITRSRERKSITVPRYDMVKLFANYPEGLATIRQECQRSKGELDNTTQDLWIGLYSTKNTIPLAVDLWKLCQMLPSSTSRTK